MIERSPNLETEESMKENMPSQLFAWCTDNANTISIIEPDSKQEWVNFQGVQLRDTEEGMAWSHVKEILNTRLLVSLHHCWNRSANMEIFEVSQKGKARKVYSFEEIKGVTGHGDLSYNSRRGLLGGICVGGKIAYHLLSVNTTISKRNDVIVELCRKSKWHPQYNANIVNFISGLDFDSSGEVIATIDRHGVCLLSDVNTSSYKFHLNMQMSNIDVFGRCRWSTNVGEPSVYVKYMKTNLNILDVEKKALTLKTPIQLDTARFTYRIDVCQSNGNLLAADGIDRKIKVYDKRVSTIIKRFEVHSDVVCSVRWDARGSMLASSSFDKTVKLLDFGTGKIMYTEDAPLNSKLNLS